MKSQSRAGAWITVIIGTLYFVIPLAATFEMRTALSWEIPIFRLRSAIRC